MKNVLPLLAVVFTMSGVMAAPVADAEPEADAAPAAAGYGKYG